MSHKPFVYSANPREATALTGIERIPVMQGGDPAETTVGAIAEAARAGGGYATALAYAPTLTFSEDGSGVVFTALGVSRVGPGDGVPSAGDVVTVVGAITFEGVVDGETIDFMLPYESGEPVFPSMAAEPTGTDATATIELASATTVRITLGVTGDDFGALVVRIIYQTAAAVD